MRISRSDSRGLLRCWPGALCLLLAGLVAAVPARGQVVQLPTLDSFSVGTTVVVPDRGSAYLGGVNRARYEASSRGAAGVSRFPGAGILFGDRRGSASASSSGAWATATIIDHREWDAATRARAAQRRDSAVPHEGVAGKAAFIRQHLGRRPSAAAANVR